MYIYIYIHTYIYVFIEVGKPALCPLGRLIAGAETSKPGTLSGACCSNEREHV